LRKLWSLPGHRRHGEHEQRRDKNDKSEDDDDEISDAILEEIMEEYAGKSNT